MKNTAPSFSLLFDSFFLFCCLERDLSVFLFSVYPKPKTRNSQTLQILPFLYSTKLQHPNPSLLISFPLTQHTDPGTFYFYFFFFCWFCRSDYNIWSSSSRSDEEQEQEQERLLCDMGIAKGPLILSNKPTNCANSSMSHDYHPHQGILAFSNPLDKSNSPSLPHQIRRDKLRVDSFSSDPLPPPPPTVAGIDEHLHHHHHHHQQHLHHVYATSPTEGTMLSDMFNYPPTPSAAPASVEFSDNFRTLRQPNSASAMQLFLMNPPPPPPPRSPSPPSTSSTLHMLLPNLPSGSLQGFESGGVGDQTGFGQFAIAENQGLSLSLHSSSLQHLEDVGAGAKADELRIRDGGMLYNYNNNNNQVHGGGGNGSNSSILQYSFRNNSENSPHSFQMNPNHQVQIGFGSSLGVVNLLRNSKYVKAAQELLEEFCSVGRVQLKKNKSNMKQSHNNPETAAGGSGGGASSSSSKDHPPLSATDRIEHQRRKVKLLSMLDEARISLSSLSLSLL